ncbi:MAG: glycoside hydrolase family 18 protein [Acidobacteriota bacterium]|nr:glycoside hydrolase family 18 protein [Acidobacteriota bacterium]
MADMRLLVLGLTFALPLYGFAAPSAAPVVAGYVFPQNTTLQPGQIDADGMTRIYYAFANIKDGRMVEGFPTDAANIPAVTALRQGNPRLEVMISVGGWLWSGEFSDMALTAKSRKVFIQSVVEFLDRYHLDGLDVDWEYPGMPGAGHAFRSEDKENFTLLLKELRKRFDAEGKKRQRRLYLTIAAGTSDEYLAHTEMEAVARSVDAVNLMTYDYTQPGVDAATGHNAPLFANPADPKQVSADATVQAFEQAGVPAEKILLGVPFYGKVWGEVADNDHGLFKPGVKAPGVDAAYSVIEETMLGHGFTRYWDETARVPYLYSEEKREFVSYEDAESIGAKCEYVRTHGLGGVMFWSYFNDPSGELLAAIDRGLHGGTR